MATFFFLFPHKSLKSRIELTSLVVNETCSIDTDVGIVGQLDCSKILGGILI